MKSAKLVITAVAMATMVIACSSTRTMHTSRSTYDDADRVSSTREVVVARSVEETPSTITYVEPARAPVIVASPAPVISQPEPFVERVAKADRN